MRYQWWVFGLWWHPTSFIIFYTIHSPNWLHHYPLYTQIMEKYLSLLPCPLVVSIHACMQIAVVSLYRVLRYTFSVISAWPQHTAEANWCLCGSNYIRQFIYQLIFFRRVSPIHLDSQQNEMRAVFQWYCFLKKRQSLLLLHIRSCCLELNSLSV